MKTIRVNVSLRPMGKGRIRYQADFVVDSHAMNSVAPASALKAAGIEPVGEMADQLPDGTMAVYPFAVVTIEFMGEITGGRVVFGPEYAEPLLGATALASVGVTVNSMYQELRRLPAVRLK